MVLALRRDFRHNGLQRYFTKKIRFKDQREDSRADLCIAFCETSLCIQKSFLLALMVNETAIVVQRTACPVCAIPSTVLYVFFNFASAFYMV